MYDVLVCTMYLVRCTCIPVAALVYVGVPVCVWPLVKMVCVCVWRERERERERDVTIYIYKYYIYIYRGIILGI